MTQHLSMTEAERIDKAIADFPPVFHLRNDYEGMYRISKTASYVSGDTLYLYVDKQSSDGERWFNFCKGTEQELHAQWVPLASPLVLVELMTTASDLTCNCHAITPEARKSSGTHHVGGCPKRVPLIAISGYVRAYLNDDQIKMLDITLRETVRTFMQNAGMPEKYLNRRVYNISTGIVEE